MKKDKKSDLEILKNMKDDLNNSKSFHDDWQTKRSRWMKEYDGKPYGNEDKDPRSNKSKLVSREIKQVAVRQLAQIADPFVSTNNMVRTVPITAEDELLAAEQEEVLNYQYCRDFDRYNFSKDGLNILQREGTVVAKISWIFEEEDIEVEVPITKMMPIQDVQEARAMIAQGQAPYREEIVGYKTETQSKTIVNKPDVELIDNAYHYVDPTCKGKAENGQFQAIVFPSNISKLKKAGIYHNLDKVEEYIAKELDKSESNYDEDIVSDFKFTDEARREFEVTEYWGNYDITGSGVAEPIVWTWVGDIIIRKDENPMPDKEVPIVSCIVDADPFSPFGKPIADLIGSHQKIITGLKRTVLNTLNASTNGQKGIKKQALDVINLNKFNAGKNFEYNGDSPEIWTGEFNQIPQSIFAFADEVRMDADSLSGTRAFSSGNGSMGSATEARGALDAIAKREVDISRNFKENFILPILRKWMMMNEQFLDPEDIYRITNKPPVERREGFSKIDLDIKIATAETNAAKSSKLAFMLQTMSASLPFDLTKMLLAEQADMEDMPGLAAKIEAYSPQPNPQDQKIKELEIVKLEAEIEDLRIKALENQEDIALKRARTQTEQAKTRKTHADADKIDQDYIRTADGDILNEEMMKQNQKIKGDIAKQSIGSQQKVAK